MKPFTDTLNQLRHGKTASELTDTLADLVKDCVDTGKAGHMTLTIKVKPGKSGQIEIEDVIVSKRPEFERGASLFFVTPEGNLSRKDPRQEELPGLARVVSREEAAG